jgi:hypothetical protein
MACKLRPKLIHRIDPKASLDADSGKLKWRHIVSDGELLEASIEGHNSKYVVRIDLLEKRRKTKVSGIFNIAFWELCVLIILCIDI